MNLMSIHSIHLGKLCPIPFAGSRVSCGFPSPADDFLENRIDLNEQLIRNPAATFFIRVQGNSMEEAGIQSGDVLIIDRSLEASNGKIIVAVLNGEFTVKRIRFSIGGIQLIAAHPHYPNIEVSPNDQFEVWGVVTSIIHQP